MARLPHQRPPWGTRSEASIHLSAKPSSAEINQEQAFCLSLYQYGRYWYHVTVQPRGFEHAVTVHYALHSHSDWPVTDWQGGASATQAGKACSDTCSACSAKSPEGRTITFWMDSISFSITWVRSWSAIKCCCGIATIFAQESWSLQCFGGDFSRHAFDQNV